MRLVLGSQSRWRRQILEGAGYDFEATQADIDEKAITAGFDDRARADASVLTLAIAQAKADALEATVPDALLITSDQVVVHDGKIREKPESGEECRAYLASYAASPACTVRANYPAPGTTGEHFGGQMGHMVTSVVVTNTITGHRVHGTDIARQHFRPIPDDVVDKLIAKGDIMYCCGGFMIDDPLLFPYLGEREGDEDSIIGMPLALLRDLISRAEAAAAEAAAGAQAQ